jgi:hypothetical protein
MTDLTHKFKVGQTVDLIPSISRSAAGGSYQIVRLRPTEGLSAAYCIKSRSEAYERVVEEGDLTLSPKLSFND